MRVPEGYQYIEFPETGSTNDDALHRAASGGNWIVLARRQTAGRGRMGRPFASADGGLYMSMTWRPDGRLENTPELTALAGRAVRDAITEMCGVTPDIKEPNDLLIGGKKICGILTEARDGDDFYMVFGIGVNLKNEIPEDLRDIAGNLRELTGKAPHRVELAELIAENLYRALTE